ncbi:unnamed protein product [Miscanthus lutarioriparius]|uniref:C2H2-type domain-containing protein n=1 Tax=Miscanthus lutarioriparius TaxID=422564 RepID=A0A811M7R1_9POAL|nr:unnamed protein product [Miscanthus lutarioriparius]
MALLVKRHHQMLVSSSTSSSSPSASQQQRQPLPAQPPPPPSSSCLTDQQPSPAKRKRRPPGTPDPDAEVVALSPRTLLESDRYVCEICGQGFQREQNLQMHRRRHKVPWRLVKRAPPPAGGEDGAAAGGGGGANSSTAGGGGGGGAPRKRVFVCPEPSCLHHDPAHALGDLVGIKKHFRRKHGGRRQWVCARCAKGYAVQSDYKAHLKTCGTRGHSCDCGRVFSRVESFIEHQDACNSSRMRGEAVVAVPPTALPVIRPAVPRHPPTVAPPPPVLQLLPASSAAASAPLLTSTTTTSLSTTTTTASQQQEPHAAAAAATTTKLQLSIGPTVTAGVDAAASAGAVGEEEEDSEAEELRRAVEEKAAADAARERARGEAAAAERALDEARRARQRARADLEKACALRDHTALLLAQVTCHACRQRSLAVAVARVGGEGHAGPAVACDSMRGGGGFGAAGI